MSQLTPHIQTLRAIAQSAMTMGSGESQHNADLFMELGWVLNRAADQLEAGEAQLNERLKADNSFHYNPKGKPTT